MNMPHQLMLMLNYVNFDCAQFVHTHNFQRESYTNTLLPPHYWTARTEASEQSDEKMGLGNNKSSVGRTKVYHETANCKHTHTHTHHGQLVHKSNSKTHTKQSIKNYSIRKGPHNTAKDNKSTQQHLYAEARFKLNQITKFPIQQTVEAEFTHNLRKHHRSHVKYTIAQCTQAHIAQKPLRTSDTCA